VGTWNHVLPERHDSPREGGILGVVQLIEKHWESVLWRFAQQKKSITASARLRQPHAMLHTRQCHNLNNYIVPMENPTSCDAAFYNPLASCFRYCRHYVLLNRPIFHADRAIDSLSFSITHFADHFNGAGILLGHVCVCP